MTELDRDGRPLPMHLRALLGGLRLLTRLGFFGSVIVHGVVAMMVVGVFHLLGRPFLDWRFVLAYAFIGPIIFGGIDRLVCMNDPPASKPHESE